MSESLNRDYQVCEEIGQGHFATVFRCNSRITGESFAVKSIEKKRLSADVCQCISTEAKILRFLSPNPHIVKVVSTYEDEFHLHIILELCSSRNLLQHIIDNGGLSESKSRSIFIQIIQAMSHMHKSGIVHRDIKLENILFSSSGNLVKISDFGLAVSKKSYDMIRGSVGSPNYMAPEMFTGRGYNEKVDVWSAGVLLYAMLSGDMPFDGNTTKDICIAVSTNLIWFPVEQFGSVSARAKDLLTKMLCRDVCKRLTADQVLRHPWITFGP